MEKGKLYKLVETLELRVWNKARVRKSKTSTGTKEDPQQYMTTPSRPCSVHFSKKAALLLVKLLAPVPFLCYPFFYFFSSGVLNSNAEFHHDDADTCGIGKNLEIGWSSWSRESPVSGVRDPLIAPGWPDSYAEEPDGQDRELERSPFFPGRESCYGPDERVQVASLAS